MPSRRQFLAACATGLVATLAGCVDPDVAMEVDVLADDRALAEQATTGRDPPPDAPYPDLLADAVDGGVEVAAERPPFEPDRPVTHDGAVYALQWESVGTETRTEYRITAGVRPDAPLEQEVALEDLPEPDELALKRLGLPRPDGPQEEIRAERTVYYDEAEREASALVPEQQYDVVGIDGTPVEIDVEPVEVQRERYRYEAEELAPTVAAFGEQGRDAYQVELDGLDAAEREFYEGVVDGSYYESDPSGAFRGVADRLVAEPAVTVEGRAGEWLVRYDGETHWVWIDFVRMEEYADRLRTGDGPLAADGGPSN